MQERESFSMGLEDEETMDGSSNEPEEGLDEGVIADIEDTEEEEDDLEEDEEE